MDTGIEVVVPASKGVEETPELLGGLERHHLVPLLRQADGGREAARAGADDNCARHGSNPPSSRLMLTVLTRKVVGVNMRTAYHHGDLRSALLQAARAMLDEGLPVGLREVARRARVSQTAPYRHFADKDALLAAVKQEGFEALTAALQAVDAPPHLPRIRALGVAYVEFAVANPGWFRAMFGEPLDRERFADCAAASSGGFRVLAQAIVAAVSAGAIEGDAHDLTLMAWSLVHGLSSLLLNGQGREVGLDPARAGELAERIVRAVTAGLALM